MIDNMDLKV